MSEFFVVNCGKNGSCLLYHVTHVSSLMSLYQVFCIMSPVSRLTSSVTSLLSKVSRLLSHVSCLTSPVSRFLSHVSLSCPTFPVSLLLFYCMSPVSRLLSQVSCFTSPVTHFQSHVSCLLSHFSSHMFPVSYHLYWVVCLLLK